MKRLAILLLGLVSTSLCAEEVTDECLRSMQDVYKFYYHEIVPKHKPESGSEKLGEAETNHMQTVVSTLKGNCSPEIVAKMNQFLQEDKA